MLRLAIPARDMNTFPCVSEAFLNVFDFETTDEEFRDFVTHELKLPTK